MFSRRQKRKPGGGNAGLDVFIIGVYGFKYAAWLLLLCAARALSGFCYCAANFFSCSSTFLFFSMVFKFNRTLCVFASFSVSLRTH
jgi:hypothetical protein